MNVLICGGRSFTDQAMFDAVMYDLNKLRGPFTVIAHGGAIGADRMAGRWAYANRLIEVIFHADWARLGRQAGFVRNQQMIDARPDLVIAFPGGRGTADTIARAKTAGLLLVEVDVAPPAQQPLDLAPP